MKVSILALQHTFSEPDYQTKIYLYFKPSLSGICNWFINTSCYNNVISRYICTYIHSHIYIKRSLLATALLPTFTLAIWQHANHRFFSHDTVNLAIVSLMQNSTELARERDTHRTEAKCVHPACLAKGTCSSKSWNSSSLSSNYFHRVFQATSEKY